MNNQSAMLLIELLATLRKNLSYSGLPEGHAEPRHMALNLLKKRNLIEKER
jgi:hypothetical protein